MLEETAYNSLSHALYSKLIKIHKFYNAFETILYQVVLVFHNLIDLKLRFY